MNPNALIKVGFCVAYDWEFLKKSLPRVYGHADKICFSLDRNRKSWSGQPYHFDDARFKQWLNEVDVVKKIDLYEDDFSLPDLTAMQNDNRQRMLMAKRMGEGGWHVQVDSDEYFLDFEDFVNKLKSIDPSPNGKGKPVNVCGLYIPLIKKLKNGYLYVDFKKQLPETTAFATNFPEYLFARKNGHFNIITPCYVIHETWARSEDDLLVKMSNWGHSSEEFKYVDKKISYFNIWKALDEENFHYVRDFHPDVYPAWPALGFCSGQTVEQFIANLPRPKFPMTKLGLWLRNNRSAVRIKVLLKKIWSIGTRES